MKRNNTFFQIESYGKQSNPHINHAALLTFASSNSIGLRTAVFDAWFIYKMFPKTCIDGDISPSTTSKLQHYFSRTIAK